MESITIGRLDGSEHGLGGQWRLSMGLIDEDPLTHLAVQANNLRVLNF